MTERLGVSKDEITNYSKKVMSLSKKDIDKLWASCGWKDEERGKNLSLPDWRLDSIKNDSTFAKESITNLLEDYPLSLLEVRGIFLEELGKLLDNEKGKECIFCKIVNGEIPSEKIYEDKNFFAFLDIHPQNKGHTVLIPKVHFENIFDSDKKLDGVSEVLYKISILLKKKYGCEGVNIINNSGKVSGQEVMHFHLHIIPRYLEDKLNLIFQKKK